MAFYSISNASNQILISNADVTKREYYLTKSNIELVETLGNTIRITMSTGRTVSMVFETDFDPAVYADSRAVAAAINALV